MANETNTMVLDFTGVESSNLIGEGVHLVRVKDAIFSKASTGSNQLEVNFENSDGATRKAWFNLLPQCLWKVKSFLEAIGIPCDGKINLSTKVLVGKTCRITVEPDPNDSKKFTITDTKPAAESTMAEAPYAAPQPTQIPVQQVAPVQPIQTASQPVMAPAQPTPAPNNNLPPWMTSAPAGTAPNGNLPPWMQQK